MKILSDTIWYREDGTISSITRAKLDEFETPSGRSASEQINETISINVLQDQLGNACATYEQSIHELEARFNAEREQEAAALAAVRTEHSATLAERDALINELSARVEQLTATPR